MKIGYYEFLKKWVLDCIILSQKKKKALFENIIGKLKEKSVCKNKSHYKNKAV